jgi:hypothetical protein
MTTTIRIHPPNTYTNLPIKSQVKQAITCQKHPHTITSHPSALAVTSYSPLSSSKKKRQDIGAKKTTPIPLILTRPTPRKEKKNNKKNKRI